MCSLAALAQAIQITLQGAALPQHYKFEPRARAVLAFALESVLTVYFYRGLLAMEHRKKKTLKGADLKLGETLSNEVIEFRFH